VRFYKRSVLVFGGISVFLGIALLVETAWEGGGTAGFILGLLFIGLGLGRLFLLRRR
jgi:dipeptide/tripeptide permease